MDYNKKITDWLEVNKEEIFTDILDSVSIYSPSEDREAVNNAILWFKDKAEKMGFDTNLRAGGEVISARFGKAEKTIGLIAHCDVVPIGDLSMWTKNPLGERADGKLFGRGVLDDKGMAILCLWCMKGIRELFGEPSWALETIIGSREEIEWTDIDRYIAEGWKLPDYSFTPDGSFPLYNREKGYCDIVFSFPKMGDDEVELREIHGAEAFNSIPGIATAKFSQSELIVRGKEVHSSSPESGDNALIKLFFELENLRISEKGYGEVYRFNRERLSRTFDGAVSLNLYRHPETLNGEDMGYTTAVPTRAEISGDVLKLGINLRTVYGTTLEELHDGCSKVCDEYGCTYEIMINQDPLYVPRDNPILKAMGQAYTDVTGDEAEFFLDAGTSYAKAFPNCISFGPVLPGTEELFHVPDEHMTEEDLLTAEKIYITSIMYFLSNMEV